MNKWTCPRTKPWMTCVIFSIALATVVPAAFAEGAAERKEVGDFALKSLKGKKVKLSDYKGSVIAINFWATWCKSCLKELPHFQKLYEKHQKSGFVVLAVTTDGPETLSEVRTLVKRKRWKMPILLDPDGSLSAILNPKGTQPFTMLLDRNGKLVEEHEGFAKGDEKKYAETIEKLLAEGS
jgi:peroxiredoxin